MQARVIPFQSARTNLLSLLTFPPCPSSSGVSNWLSLTLTHAEKYYFCWSSVYYCDSVLNSGCGLYFSRICQNWINSWVNVLSHIDSWWEYVFLIFCQYFCFLSKVLRSDKPFHVFLGMQRPRIKGQFSQLKLLFILLLLLSYIVYHGDDKNYKLNMIK